MIKKYFYTISILFGLLLSLESCVKPSTNPVIPPLPSRMYGFLDGVNWVLPTYSAVYFKQSNVLMITATNPNGYRLYFYIHTKLQDGVFPCNSNSGKNMVTMTHDIGSDHFDFYSYAGNNTEGQIELKGLDVANKAINGTFSLRLVSPSSGQSHLITGGVFQNVPYVEDNNTLGGAYLANVNGAAWIPQNSTLTIMQKNFIINAIDTYTGQNTMLLFPNNLGKGKYPMRVLGDIMGVYRPNFNNTQFSFSPQDTLFVDIHNPDSLRYFKGRLMMQTQDFSGLSSNNTQTASINFFY